MYILLETVIWTLLSAILKEQGEITPLLSLAGSWIISIISELVLLGLKFPPMLTSPLEQAQTVFAAFRLAFLTLLFILTFHHPHAGLFSQDEEQASLLDPKESFLGGSPTSSKAGYGSVKGSHLASRPGVQGDADANEQGNIAGDVSGIAMGTSILPRLIDLRFFVPLFWPPILHYTNLCILATTTVTILECALTLLLPWQIGQVIDLLQSSPGAFASDAGYQIGILLLFFYLASPGCLHQLKSLCISPLKLQAQRKVKLAIHSKYRNLLREVDKRKSLMDIDVYMGRGSGLVKLVFLLAFGVIPFAIDVLMACIYLSITFGVYMLVLLLGTAVLYSWAMIIYEKKLSVLQHEIQSFEDAEHEILWETPNLDIALY